MPSNHQPLGALPARFRRERLLIVGCGDVGQRVAGLLRGRVQVIALTSSPERLPALRGIGARPITGDLDAPATLRRLAGVATRVVHLAPPRARNASGEAADGSDPRTVSLMRTLRLRSLPAALVYGSTSGVSGDCGGAIVDESRPVRPSTARAQRRVAAERAVRWLGRGGVRATILRIPGIYAPNRDGGTPKARLARGTPVLRAEDDVYTNHIHADDLARAMVAALWRGRPQRIVHASDDSDLRMGDYFDLAADLYGVPRPPRISRDEARQLMAPEMMSFMGESRRLNNMRLKRELRLVLKYPTVAQGLRS